MGTTLTNDFSWSKSRHEKFSECLRAYYLHYYGSWGGWEDQAPEEVRALYILKKLHNRFTWAGGVVHETIKRVLHTLRAGRTVDPEMSIAWAHRLMREDWKHSSSRGYWKERIRKEFGGLVEHEYGMAIPAEEWKRNWDNAREALLWFFGSRWPSLAKSLRREQWLEVDEGFEFSSFQVDGVKVFAIPDFAFVDEAGRPLVVDWKTGKARDGYDDQVLGYALYVSRRYGFPIDQVRATLVYLNDGIEREVPVDQGAIDGFLERMRRSVDSMRALLADPAANVPQSRESFPMTEDFSACNRCVFRRVCGRDEARVAAKVA
jgi:PD-(D/E)XK nuclease superfamily